MPRRIILALGMVTLLTVSACAGSPASAPVPAAPSASEAASEAPASETPASEAPATAPAASESAAAGGGCAPATEAGTVNATMGGFAFGPATITAKVGDVVAWTNTDAVGHTATVTDDPTCTTANLGKGQTGAIGFTAAGSYPFFCKVHPDMKGTVEVS